MQPGGALTSVPNTAEHPRLLRMGSGYKSPVTYRLFLSFCFCVFHLFFDLWTMKCFPEEWVPFEMHILKVLYSINGLVFLNHLSQTP